MTAATFTVPGLPRPQGSKKAVTRGGKTVLIETAAGLSDWRTAVARAAATERERLGGRLLGPLSLTVVFTFPMPPSRGPKARAAGIGWKTTTPDLDKLVRAVGDALKVSGLIEDDARLAAIHASKIETVGALAGVAVDVHEITVAP